MICPHCNEKYSDNLLVCPYCGKRKTDVAPPTEKPQKTPPQPGVKNYEMPPMKWYNWELYVVFLIVPIVTLAQAVIIFATIIGENLTTPEIAYYAFTIPCSVVIAVLELITRSKLKNYKKSAPKWVLSMYILGAVASLITAILNAAAIDIIKNVTLYVAITYWLDLIWDALMIILVRTYYRKRKKLFTN